MGSCLLKCIWQIFLICSIKSPQCADKCSKKDFSIAIFLSRVLMYQKHQISLPVGYKTARPKQGTGNDCDVNSELQASWKTDFLINNALLYHFLANWLAHNKKMLNLRRNFAFACTPFLIPSKSNNPIWARDPIEETRDPSMSSWFEPAIWSRNTGQSIPCLESGQFIITWILNVKDVPMVMVLLCYFCFGAYGRTHARTDCHVTTKILRSMAPSSANLKAGNDVINIFTGEDMENTPLGSRM